MLPTRSIKYVFVIFVILGVIVCGILVLVFTMSETVDGRNTTKLFNSIDSDRFFPSPKHTYECMGSCFCGSTPRRVGLVSKSVGVVVAAVSSIVAVKVADGYIQDQCERLYNQICRHEPEDTRKPSGTHRGKEWNKDDDDVLWEVEECVVVDPDEIKEDIPNEIFTCRGYCLPSRRIRSRDGIEMREKINCESYHIEKDIVLTIDEMFVNSNSLNNQARNKFKKFHLTQYCADVGRKKYLNVNPTTGARRRKFVKFCTSSYGSAAKNHKHIKNYSCEKLT